MHNPELAADYIRRAAVRLKALDVLFAGESWADVVRESQEVVELALKALLRSCGIDPPRTHDVSEVLLREEDRLPGECARSWERSYRRRVSCVGTGSWHSMARRT